MSSKSAEKLELLQIGLTSPLKMMVWRVRRSLRIFFRGKDVLDVEASEYRSGKKIRHIYRQIDTFMTAFFPAMVKTTQRKVAIKRLRDMITELDYRIVDADESKPWGAYYRMDSKQVERFIHEFFPDLSLKEARLGHDDIELSPKFLLVVPGQRLSWQFHHRRAERWRFLSKGAYYKSDTDAQGARIVAPAGTIVQFGEAERHRLCAYDDNAYTLVAEIWQHTDPAQPSEESDIIRLADDYNRSKS